MLWRSAGGQCRAQRGTYLAAAQSEVDVELAADEVELWAAAKPAEARRAAATVKRIVGVRWWSESGAVECIKGCLLFVEAEWGLLNQLGPRASGWACFRVEQRLGRGIRALGGGRLNGYDSS